MSIVIENLSYIYKKNTPLERGALKNINLKIEAGEFVGIIGHTGSGKTTLVQHLNGLLKPTSGRVMINGIDTRSRDIKSLRRNVGVIFQYPEHQLFEETVYKDIAFGLVKLGLSRTEIDERVKKAAATVGLPANVLEVSPFELSGGQKRRVAIAGVAVMDPEILVMDEPTAGLDPRGRDELCEYITRLHRESGKILIIVSHSMEDVAKLVNRVVVMAKGEIVMDAPPGEVFMKTGLLESIGLSAPQITYFMKKLKKDIPALRDDIFTVKEAADEIYRLIRSKSNK